MRSLEWGCPGTGGITPPSSKRSRPKTRFVANWQSEPGRVHGCRKRETFVIRHVAGSYPGTRSSPRGRPCDTEISMAREKGLVEDMREVGVTCLDGPLDLRGF